MLQVTHIDRKHLKVEGACVDIEFLVLGMIENNTYFISDGRATMIVDPSSNCDQILATLGDKKLDVIYLTHFHWDHIGAAHELREATGATVVASAVDADAIETPGQGSGRRAVHPCTVDRRLEDGEVLEVGGMQWKTILTPGHSEGGMCLFLDSQYGSDPTGTPVLVSGDILFAGTHGRTDFEGGDPQEMRASLKKLAQLPDETLVLPGHNNLTTIAAERRTTLA